MFRNRQSSQRPPEELFEHFKKSFPDIRSGTGGSEISHATAAGNPQDVALNHHQRSSPLHRNLLPPWVSHNGLTLDGGIRFGHEDLDPTPRAPAEPFRFTPSLLDPNSSAFAAFANQPPGYYAQTPGITNGTFTNHLNDMPTPNVGISIGTPLSLASAIAMPPPVTACELGFAPQTIQSQQYSAYLPFPQSLQPQYVEPTFEQPHSRSGSPMDMGGEVDVQQQMVSMYGKQYEHEHAPCFAENFRFHVTLNAPTAMIKHPDEIPVTYLNKGQSYSISIVDTSQSLPSNTPARYRTYIRISFHDENQRARPAQCWQLWKEGRGTNEAHQRGGKLQAVEYVDGSGPGEDEKKRGKSELESASFDGFAVIWSPPLGGPAETSISVRFNFLSTDFSHSKGVKGIPVRLCAKTELLSSGSPRSPSKEPEICFGKVKLFRDHGAERKLANDVLHVKKTIEKLRQQLQQSEGTGMKLFGKKKKEEDLSKASKPGKAPKHKRTWSVSSAGSVGGGKSVEEEINEKLAAMQDMFTSTRPISVLYLRGTGLDDPDRSPVYLPGEGREEMGSWARRRRSSVATSASSFVSPSPSSASLSQHGDSRSPERREWAGGAFQQLQHVNTNGTSDGPVRIKLQNDTGTLTGWIEAIDIDANYRPPVERPSKASMCIYILPSMPGSILDTQLYRAAYLTERTEACLTAAIAAKCGIDPSSVIRTTFVNPQGLDTLVDDDVVQQMGEGRAMKVQVNELENKLLSEWDLNGEMKDVKPCSGYELKLMA